MSVLTNEGPSVTQLPIKDFTFENKVFDAPGAHFAQAKDSKEPLFYVQMGENLAALHLTSLRKHFGIHKGSQDDTLLTMVPSSLNFVKRIHPGDAIPTEVLNGRASWPIEKHHREMVEMNLTVALARWIMGTTDATPDPKTLMKMAQDPDMKQRAQSGIDKIAEEMGIGTENRQQVIDTLERLTDELSYIEALKEHFGGIHRIAVKLQQAAGLLADDRTLCEEISRIRTLMTPPMKRYSTLFRELDAEAKDILALVKNDSRKVDLIRRTRDDLRSALLAWQDLIHKWDDQVIATESGLEALVRETYRFVARHFPQAQNWGAS